MKHNYMFILIFEILYTFAFSRNAIIWKRCASTFRGGHANFQLRAAFLGRVVAVLRFLYIICVVGLSVVFIMVNLGN